MILVQLTDLHVRPVGMAAYRIAETNQLTERALRRVATLKQRPDAVVISGDLTDNGLVAEYTNLVAMLQRTLSVPVYLIPGNHDRREVMKAEMASFPGVTAHPDFVQYVIDDHALRLVMLDTVIPGSGAGELCAARMAWLDAALAAAPERPTVVVMHHPPFLTGIGHMDAINLRNAAEFTALVAQHKQVRRVLCGHVHRPINVPVAHAIGSIAPSVAHQVEFVLGDDPGFWNLDPPAFQVHTTLGDVIASHVVYVDDHTGPVPFMLDPDYPGRPPHTVTRTPLRVWGK